MLALGAVGAASGMAIAGVGDTTIEIIMGVAVTPLLTAFIAQLVGETRSAVSAVQQQTNGTQTAMIAALRDHGQWMAGVAQALAAPGAAPPQPPASAGDVDQPPATPAAG